ncbi:MAG: LysR substrate-binding domain-containing protein [Burkholderiaceae bacterium]
MTAPSELRLPSIDGLRAFEAAARLGTFERAADELAVTASAIGKRVAAIEETIGAPVFVRTGRVLALTAGGREYLEQVRAALALLSAMPQHRRRGARRERLRVVAPPTFARQVLVPELASFGEACPWVELEIVLSIPYVAGPAGDADVEVRHGDASEAGGRVLMDDLVLPLAAPALLARLPALRAPADLRGAPLLRTPIDPWTPWLRAAGLDWPEPDTGTRFVDLGLTLEAAVGGQGVALARPSLARAWLREGRLVAPFALAVRPAASYHLLPHASGRAAEAFAAWLAQCCARIADESLAFVSGLR